MADQKFRVNQVVDFVATKFHLKPMGQFKIVRALPTEHGIRHYRIQSIQDGHERVAIESELE